MTIERTYDYELIAKMVDWPDPPPESPEVIYLIADSILLFGFFPYRDGFLGMSGIGVKSCGLWATEARRKAISWIFSHTGAKAIYAGCVDLRECNKCLLEDVGMVPSHKEEEAGEVVEYYKIENLNNLDCSEVLDEYVLPHTLPPPGQ